MRKTYSCTHTYTHIHRKYKTDLKYIIHLFPKKEYNVLPTSIMCQSLSYCFFLYFECHNTYSLTSNYVRHCPSVKQILFYI